jgi:hypothetical protein
VRLGLRSDANRRTRNCSPTSRTWGWRMSCDRSTDVVRHGWNTWRGLVGRLAGSSDDRRTAATDPTEVATNRAGARSCLTVGALVHRPVTFRTAACQGDNSVPSGLPIARATRRRTLHRHSERNRSGDWLSSRGPDHRTEKTHLADLEDIGGGPPRADRDADLRQVAGWS